jgi:hypothetical protein
MTLSPPVQRHHSYAAPAVGFLAVLKYWMGRIISTCMHLLPLHLYELICKTKEVAKPVMNREISPEISPLTKRFPIQKEQTEPKLTAGCMDSFLTFIGLDSQDFLAEGIISDLEGNEQPEVDKASLTGYYQMKWMLPLTNNSQDSKILIYKGNFEHGIFHGAGAFFISEPNHCLYLILEGRFKQGSFVAGLMVMDDCYIDGCFINGEKRGNGAIHYLIAQVDEKGIPRHVEYRGDFYDGKPQGKGKLLAINNNGIKVLGEGEFEDGKLHGQGMWKGTEFYQYEDLEPVANGEQEGEMECIEKRGQVEVSSIGRFIEGKFYEGSQEIFWPEKNWHGKGRFENGKMIEMEVTVTSGITYRGEFTPYTLDGKGTIFGPTGQELYTGDIYHGFPHGQGYQIKDGMIEKGTFEWGYTISEK